MHTFELFRRATCGSDPTAWSALVDLYQPLVIAALRQAAGERRLEHEPDLVAQAFERFRHAVDAHRFEQFADLPGVLRYLRLCAYGVALDAARPAETNRAEAPALWSTVERTLGDDAERTFAYLSFVRGLDPCQIRTLRPRQFRSVEELHRTRRRVVDKLCASTELRALLTAGPA
jgi:hypothetical protein